MSSDIAGRPETLHQRVIRDAIAARGYLRGTYAFYDTTGEGHFFPIGSDDDPVEETSGNLVTRGGEHIYFWVVWDEGKGSPTMLHWEKVEPEKSDWENPEYLAARKAVGLPT
jgi:hypothetical protein